ncbi:hypothetical protein GXW82_32755 [Streptacidiphilus sp. 4-A2]|nr:hypothetical protein [Streptacidiphilus sp. 4-A2]
MRGQGPDRGRRQGLRLGRGRRARRERPNGRTRPGRGILVRRGASQDIDGVLPTTRAYTSYLLATVHSGSFAEGLAAVLPCYWIYARVGEALLAESSPDPLYARWIAAYADEGFQAVVRRVLELTDRIGEELSEAERLRAAKHFAVTARYEWMFWDAAWRGETWPV